MVLLAATFTTGSVRANSPELEGVWICAENGSELDLVPTAAGFRARHPGHQDWIQNTEVFDRNYRDRNGNRFHHKKDGSLRFTSFANREETYRRKANMPTRYTDTGRRGNIHEGMQRDCPYCRNGNHKGHAESPNRKGWNSQDPGPVMIEGKWFSRSGRNVIEIETFRGMVRAKSGRHGRWIQFTPDRWRGFYTDRKGNSIRILGRDTLQWIPGRGRFVETYYRLNGRGKMPREHWR